MRAFTVQFRKYPDRLHWRHDATLLGEDEHGTWVGLTPGATVQCGTEPPVSHPYAAVSPIMQGSWYIPIFSPSDPRFPVYVDICSPVERTAADRATAFDLDLDVVLNPDGHVEILDRDEFADHSTRYAYPEELILGAEAATEYVAASLLHRHGPFGGVADRWLAKLATTT